MLVIDADLRRSGFRHLLATPNEYGLIEILTAQRERHEVIRPLRTQALFLLSSGSRPPNPVALLASRMMQDPIAPVWEEYDYVVIASPPVMPVAAAVLLATMADGVVLAVNSQKPSYYVVKEARSLWPMLGRKFWEWC